MSNVAYIKINFPVETNKQIESILKYPNDNIFVEEKDGNEIPELKKTLKLLEKEDTLIVYSLTAIWHSKKKEDVFKILIDKEIRLISILEGIDTQEEEYHNFLQNVVLYRKVEEKVRSIKISNSINLRRVNGSSVGRPKIASDQQEDILRLFKQKMTLREIASVLGISLGTVHKYVKLQSAETKEKKGD